MRLALAVALAVSATSCVRVQWDKKWREEPVLEAATDALRVGKSDIDAILARLGAPQIVRPATRNGAWLIWAWGKQGGWGIRVSVPVRISDVSFTWEEAADSFQGLAARLDQDLVLRELRRGTLASLLKGAVDPTRRRRKADEFF